VFALGVTTVAVTATDGAGNHSSRTFTVTVSDTTAPVLTVSADVTAEATSAAGAPVSYAGASATDAVGPVTIAYSHGSGAVFALGVTTVAVTATDGAGNHSSRTFTVTVSDTTAPAMTLPGSLTAEATSAAGANVSYAPATASDAVGPVTITYSTPSGSTFALGVTVVTVTARDQAGNRAVGTFTVTVRDTTAPVVTVTAPAEGATIGTAESVTFSYKATDAVGVTSSSATLDGAPIASGAVLDGSRLAVGPHTIVVTAQDAAGHITTVTRHFTVASSARIDDLIVAVVRGLLVRKIDLSLAGPLLVKLASAQENQARGNKREAANNVKAFVNQVKAQRGKKIDAAYADKLIALGNAVIAQLVG
jgi:hypothetical protein